MLYEHGISIQEKPGPEPARPVSSAQVAIGTAPVNLLADPYGAVNKTVIAYTLDDVHEKLGYSEDFESYTLSETVYSTFHFLKTAPVVFINVLDPAIHNKDVENASVALVKGRGRIDAEGVLLDTVQVRGGDGSTAFVRDVDFTLAFGNDKKPVIAALAGGVMIENSSVTVSYTALDPSKVTKLDIIGGYDTLTGKYSGIELVRDVFPQHGVIPFTLSAPGWSHIPEVAAILNIKTDKINGNFNAHAVLDVDSGIAQKKEDVPQWKEDNNYINSRSTVAWPKVKVGQKELWYSSVVAATMSRTDAENENVPSHSPSNKKIGITATVLPDGTEVVIDQQDANYLNGYGIMTALTWAGWRTWGNNTSIYPTSNDVKARFISIRRMFDWWGNHFFLTYFDKVDANISYRLIESIVDAENLKANGYAARGHIAGAEIEFRQDMNPIDDILNGKITFVQRIGAFVPAEHIVNVLEYDTNMMYDSLFGGDQQ